MLHGNASTRPPKHDFFCYPKTEERTLRTNRHRRALGLFGFRLNRIAVETEGLSRFTNTQPECEFSCQQCR